MANPSKTKSPKSDPSPELTEALNQYAPIAPEDIEYFTNDETKLPPGADDVELLVRFCVVPVGMLRTLSAEENARYMTADQMRRLSANIGKDNALTSVVCVYPELETKKLIVLSGNHRVEVAIGAGHKVVPVLVIQTHLGRDRKISIQLSHNAISGQDDPNLLKKHYESLSLQYKAYSGLTDDSFPALNKLNIDGLSLGAPQYEEISLLFLPDEKTVFLEQIKRFEKAKDSQTALIAAYADFQKLFFSIVEVKEFKNVFNSAVAIRLMADLAMERLEQLKIEQAEKEAAEGEAKGKENGKHS